MPDVSDEVTQIQSLSEAAKEVLATMGISREDGNYRTCLAMAREAVAHSRKRHGDGRSAVDLRGYMLEYMGEALAPFYEDAIGRAEAAARLIDGGGRVRKPTADMLLELVAYAMSDFDRIGNVRISSMELTKKKIEGDADVDICRIHERVGFDGDVALYGEGGSLILARPLMLHFERWDSLIRRAEIYNDEIRSRILQAASQALVQQQEQLQKQKQYQQQQGGVHIVSSSYLKRAAGCEFWADSAMLRRADAYRDKVRRKCGFSGGGGGHHFHLVQKAFNPEYRTGTRFRHWGGAFRTGLSRDGQREPAPGEACFISGGCFRRKTLAV